MPHPVGIDHPGAGLLGNGDHPAVDVRGHTAEQLLGDTAHPLGPVLSDQIVIAANATAGDDYRRGTKLKFSHGFS